jgi:putative ABC transport system ATP-binding protein
MSAVPVIETEGLSRAYRVGTATVSALSNVSLTISTGEFVALMGASGSGKSTLLHLLGCLDTPTAGRYRLEGREVSALSPDERARVRNQRIGFIFQSFNLLPRLSALENVTLPLMYRRQSNATIRQAPEALERVGLADRANHPPNALSGGERQRVAIARALVTRPAILLADEPTGNLDSQTGLEIMNLLLGLNAEGATIIVVTHDMSVAGMAGRTYYLRDGRLRESEGPIVAH